MEEGSVFVRESRNGEAEGWHATHKLALRLLSPPPVTRLKIKIKIKCDGGSRAGAIAPRSMEGGCKGDNWLNITRCTAGSREERGYVQEAGHQRSPQPPDKSKVKIRARVCAKRRIHNYAADEPSTQQAEGEGSPESDDPRLC